MYKKGQLISSLFLALIVAGCSTQTKTVTTETVYEPGSARASADASVRRTETTETRTEERESGGLLSGTVDVIGKTLALPFRFVGGLIDAIF